MFLRKDHVNRNNRKIKKYQQAKILPESTAILCMDDFKDAF